LNGEFLPEDHHSIIDSTAESHAELGQAFKLFIPYVVEYGYPGHRHGEILVVDGTYLSVRAFELDYASYQGAYRDNPFVLRVTQRPAALEPDAPETREYMDSTVREFSEIARESGGEVVYSDGEEDVVDKIAEVIRRERGRSLDLVLALDTTKSMENDVPHLRASLVPLLEEEIAGFSSFRIGMVYYKDYLEDYLTQTVEFQDDLSVVQRAIDGVRVRGGRDLPEAVHEALYAAVTNFPWQAESRLVILIGDAPPHSRPRGSITRGMVYSEAAGRDVTIHTMILPP
jgi:Mg-chelatase subunit ChlD